MTQVKTTCSNMAGKEGKRIGKLPAPGFDTNKFHDFSTFPDILFDVLLSRLTSSEGIVTMCLARINHANAAIGETLKYKQLSLSQLEQVSGLPRSTVIAAVRSLTDQKIIIKHEGGQDGRLRSVYSYNTDDKEWDLHIPLNRQTTN